MRTPPPRLVGTVIAVTSLVLSCAGRPDEARPEASACVPHAVEPDEPQAFRSGGSERRYLLSVPDEPPSPDGFPLVVSLHGHGGSATEHEANTSLAARAIDDGFVVATPDALGSPRRWNFDRRADGPDDYAFVAGLVNELIRRACIDPARVYVAGSSNGAAFAGFLACTEPTRIAAVAMVIATVPPSCPDDVTPSILTIRGTADATVPYGDTPQMVDGWAEHDRCTTPAQDDEPHPGVVRTTYENCAGRGQVVLVTVTGGIHAWPGSVGADRSDNSEAGTGFSATDQVLTFFDSIGAAS